jgi:hypothetical protein
MTLTNVFARLNAAELTPSPSLPSRPYGANDGYDHKRTQRSSPPDAINDPVALNDTTDYDTIHPQRQPHAS